MAEGAKPVKPLGPSEKRTWPRHGLKRAAWGLAGRLPGSRGRLARRIAAALARPAEGPAWFAVPYRLADGALGDDAVIRVDPRRIAAWMVAEALDQGSLALPRDHFIGGGDWGRFIRPLDRSSIAGEVEELIACGGDVRATPTFARVAAALGRQGSVRHNGQGFSDIDNFDAYLTRHFRLIDSVRTHGLLSRRELRTRPALAAPFKRGSRLLDHVERDAGVAIGAGGELLRYRTGFHRTAIALALGLDTMPVAVRLIHATWLKGEIVRGGADPMNSLNLGLARLAAGA